MLLEFTVLVVRSIVDGFCYFFLGGGMVVKTFPDYVGLLMLDLDL